MPSARIQHALDGRIIDDSIYSQGGKILILAFKPDVGIEANEEFDKVTLLIIRGIMDAFHDNAAETKLRIIFTEEEDRADFVLDGYVTQMARPSFLSRWLFMSKKNLLAVEGKITRRDSINPSIFFTQKTIAPDMTFSEIALFCGKKIGDFIIQGE